MYKKTESKAIVTLIKSVTNAVDSVLILIKQVWEHAIACF